MYATNKSTNKKVIVFIIHNRSFKQLTSSPNSSDGFLVPFQSVIFAPVLLALNTLTIIFT